MLFAELDIAVLHKRLQALDAGVLVLGAVDFFNRQVLADRRRLLPHDLGKVILELHRLDPEFVVGPLIIPLQAAAGLQRVLDDLVGFPLCDVRDDHIQIAGHGILGQRENAAGVRFLVFPQRWVVCPDKQKTRVGEVRLLLSVIVPEVEPFFLEGAVFRVNRVVLDFAVKAGLAL